MELEKKAAAFLAHTSKPDTAIILGTGLGIMEDAIAIEKACPYGEIPGFPRSTAPHHSGRMLFGRLGNTPVVAMSGRFHLYEGYTPLEVTFPVRVFKLMGIKRLFISNAAGGLRPDLTPGSVMMIRDHINFTGRNPLIGPNNDEFGPRFPEMDRPYAPQLMNRARISANKLGINLHEGVYLQLPGPSMETAAETRMIIKLGADAVGMSTVMEVIEAVHCGMDVLGISAVTNNNNPDDYKGSSLDYIISMAEDAGPRIAAIFKDVLNSISSEEG
jgi:purine-nucleoside phosphorylase